MANKNIYKVDPNAEKLRTAFYVKLYLGYDEKTGEIIEDDEIYKRQINEKMFDNLRNMWLLGRSELDKQDRLLNFMNKKEKSYSWLGKSLTKWVDDEHEQFVKDFAKLQSEGMTKKEAMQHLLNLPEVKTEIFWDIEGS